MKIVFDFAGVLFHWQPAELVRRVLPCLAADEAAARHLADAIFQGYGGDWGDFDRGSVEVPELVSRIVARTGLEAAAVRAVVDAVPGALQPPPAMLALLQRLRQAGRRLHFLSNMPRPYADALERTHAFLGDFDSGVFSSRVGWVKPEPQIYALAAQRFGVQPAQLLFFDDVPQNVEAARRAGWQAWQFVDADGCATRLRECGCL